MKKTILSILLLITFSCFSQKPGLRQDIQHDHPNNTPDLTDTNQLSIKLNNGWNWISFPGIERDSNNLITTEPAISRISSYPDVTLTLIDPSNPSLFKRWEPEPVPHFYGALDYLLPIRGYCLYIESDKNANIYLEQSFSLVQSNPEIIIPANEQSIPISYIEKHAQMPWDAFPEDLYNGPLNKIQTKNWTMVKDHNGKWIISNKVRALHFGEMIMVSQSTNSDYTFRWNSTEKPALVTDIQTPENYNWEEKMTYVPMYFHLGANHNIAEIAIFIDQICVGASYAGPNDTVVEVDAYLEGHPSTSVIQIEILKQQNSIPERFTSYFIFDPKKESSIKKTLIISEIRKYCEISLETYN